MDKKIIKNKISKYRPSIIAFLKGLISIPTSNPPGENYERCAAYLVQRLSEWGFNHRLITKSYGDYPRYLLLGSYGRGKNLLHFHGHYDVVPAGSADQFKPYCQKDLLFGRGSSDMKGGLASMLFALRLVQESGLGLDGQITFSIVPDEETGGFLGTKYLIEADALPQPRLGMLMPEPTSGIVWNANKGALTYQITIRGKSSHVGLAHQGVNAFEQMVDVVHSFLKLKKDIEKRKTSLPVTPPEANYSVMLMGGKSESGFSFNVVPDRAYFTVDRRINPEETLFQAKQEILDILDDYRRRGVKIETEILQEGEPSVAGEESRLALALKESIREVTREAPRFELCPGLCEIRFFNNRQIPAYAYGPGLLKVSHGPEEYVRIEDILHCTEVYVLTALRLLSRYFPPNQ